MCLEDIRQTFKQATEGRKVKDIKLLETRHFSNPLYVGYNSVINFSKYIIRRMSGEIGDDVNASSFLFDMSMLFEYYVRKLLIRNVAFCGGRLASQKGEGIDRRQFT